MGASAGLGRALAEEAARRGHNLLLVASDPRDLAALSAHLRLRYSIRAEYLACHVTARFAWTTSIIEASARFNPIEGLFFPIGCSLEDDKGTLDECGTRQLVEANFLSVACLVPHFWPAFLARGYGYIVGFGSIAAIRGRKSNAIYSAAKRALLSYFESMRHLASNTGIRVQFYLLGYVDTQQTFGRRLFFPKCLPQSVARRVVANLDKDIGVVFYPTFWKIIAAVLRWVPWAIFKRLNV